jgi:flagellar hook-associated protein 1 FlgK
MECAGYNGGKMSALSIGLSGLQVAQTLLDLTGQNITNANTPGYHNQVADLAEIGDGTQVGAGVQITNISRNTDQSLQDAVNNSSSASNSAQTQLSGLNQLQTYLATGSGTLHDSLVSLFSDLETLSANPGSATQSAVVISDADNVANQLNGTMANIDQMSGGLVQQAQSFTDNVNALTTQIAQLNQQIQTTTASGQNANSLLDTRDQAIANLSQIVGVQTVQQSGEVSVFVGGTALVLGSQATSINTTVDNQGNLEVTAGSQTPITVSGGNLGGIVTLYNSTLPAVVNQLNTFTQALTTQFDQLQATGLGSSGPMTSLTSQRAVDSVNAPLASAGLSYPPQAGDLYVTVVNQATGQQTLNKIAIDPATESLTDVASAISSIPNMNAVVNAQNGELNLFAAPGYAFDFTGSVSSSPDSQAITGTTVPTLSGAYTGTGDDTLNFAFSGAGTVGTTAGLTLNVTNSAGARIASLNVGQGYSAGTNLTVDGVNVQLTAGTVNAGDTFSENVTANPDSANVLPALGLNSFFVGNSAADLQVNQSLLNNPGQLAVSSTGQAGDTNNLVKFVNLQTQPVLAKGTQSMLQYLEGIIGNVGTQASNMQASSTANSSLHQQLSTQLQNTTGVDTNDALTQLIQYQQAYQMSAQFVATVNQTLNDFFTIITPTLQGG